MTFPSELKYSTDHEWIRLENDIAYIGITGFAQGELGDIVFLDVDTVGETLNSGDIFGSIEAVKTVSDLFMPVNGEILELNSKLESNPELINSDPYGEGWIIKVSIKGDISDKLLDANGYQELVG